MSRAIALAVVVTALAAQGVARADETETETEDVPKPPADVANVQRGWFLVGSKAQPFSVAYESWFGEARHEAHYGRAAVEIGGLMAAGLLYYWNDPLANSADWDNPSIDDRVTLRFLRFDTNLNTTNHLLHPLAGGIVYGVARVNGLSIPASFAYGLAQTALWEFALEWREKASINDLVYTSIGGMAVGEVGFQAGEYFNSAGRDAGVAQEAAAWTLGFVRRIHRVLDGDGRDPLELPKDRLGFSSAYGHEFTLAYEPGVLRNDAGDSGVLHTARIGASFATMPGFQRPGRFDAPFADGNFTDLRLRVGWDGGDGDLVESDLELRATLLGQYSQGFREDGRGRLHGQAGMIGLGPALRFQHSSWLGREDQLSTVHLPGPHAELWAKDGWIDARLGAEAYVDFASIGSLAYPKYVDTYTFVGTKSVLQRESYAFMLGGWARLRGQLTFGPASVRGAIGYGTYGSIDGLDRFQEQVTRDIHGTEDVLEVEASASLRLLQLVDVGIGFRERRRESALADVSVRRRDDNLYFSAGLSF